MRIDICTLFPEMCETVLEQSITGRARKKGLFELYCHQIRDYTTDKHRRVDDTPYSEMKGMLMQADPIYNCYKAVTEGREKPHVIYMSPKGKTLTQQRAKELSQLSCILILCGHYEGVDERILEEICDEEISIGDYVLTGGELPALVLCDAVLRMIPGVLAREECFKDESHFSGLLEYPQYTRPEIWHGRSVPKVLLSGHHENISNWRREQMLLQTELKRPELLEACALSESDWEMLVKIHSEIDEKSDEEISEND